MFSFEEQKISGLYLITPSVYSDDRGSFKETYKKSEFALHGICEEFCQDNYSVSRQGVLRGLHYQDGEHAQGKLVRCVKGAIYDVAVDLRRGSESFGEWVGVVLSDANHCMLYIPKGFAHGFYTISEEAEVAYKTTHEYAPQSDKGLLWNDPDVNITWPSMTPILSPKDMKHPMLRDVEF
jgi:dTDP-4-dehydrorhamnose 3,5-epimerase